MEQRPLLAGAIGMRLPNGATVTERPDVATIDLPGFRLVVERWALGRDHAWTVVPAATLQGSTFEALAAFVDRMVETRLAPTAYLRLDRELDFRPAVEWVARTRPIPADGSPMAVDVVAVNGVAYLVTGALMGAPGDTLNLVRYESILESFDSLAPETVVALDGRISATIDSSHHVDTSTPWLLRVAADGIGLFGLPSGMSIWWAHRGDALTFDSPGSGGRVTIHGDDLNELARSLARVDSTFAQKPVRTTFDGRPAFRWSVVVASNEWFGPIRSTLTIVVDRGNVFAMSGGDDLLATVRILD